MSKTTTNVPNIPATDSLDPEVLAFRQAFDGRSPLDEIIHEGARRMLQAAIDAAVDAFIETHQDYRDSNGRRLVVKNCSLPTREILTGAGNHYSRRSSDHLEASSTSRASLGSAWRSVTIRPEGESLMDLAGCLKTEQVPPEPKSKFVKPPKSISNLSERRNPIRSRRQNVILRFLQDDHPKYFP